VCEFALVGARAPFLAPPVGAAIERGCTLQVQACKQLTLLAGHKTSTGSHSSAKPAVSCRVVCRSLLPRDWRQRYHTYAIIEFYTTLSCGLGERRCAQQQSCIQWLYVITGST
jgi:hypothetical protein